jgi:hypothetical protein
MLPIDELFEASSIPVIENADIIYIERLMSNQIYGFIEEWRLKGKGR